MIPDLDAPSKELSGHEADKVIENLNKLPLLMKKLDETDENGNKNIALEAIKSLQYDEKEGALKSVISFKKQGNELYKIKHYKNAIEFYDKALELRTKSIKEILYGEDGDKPDDKPDDTLKNEFILCLLNRAACNLELKNYKKCINDCNEVLKMDPNSKKALYRAAKSYLELNKTDECYILLEKAFSLYSNDDNFKSLLQQLITKRELLDSKEIENKERKEKEEKINTALSMALKRLNILTVKSLDSSDLQLPHDVRVRYVNDNGDDLDVYKDPVILKSNPIIRYGHLEFPVVLLYPISFQSDFISAWEDVITLGDQLDIVFQSSPDWDKKHEYNKENVQAFLITNNNNIIQMSNQTSLLTVLCGTGVPVQDGIVKIHIIPKPYVNEWLQQFKKQKIYQL